MEKSIIQDLFLSTLNIYTYLNNYNPTSNSNSNIYKSQLSTSNKINDTIDSNNYNTNENNNNKYMGHINYNNHNNNNNYNNQYYTANYYFTKDNMLFLLIVIVLIYTFIQRERKMLSETNTFKQILNFTPTLIVLEINFNQKIVNTVNPVLTKSNSSNNLTQYFNIPQTTSTNNININLNINSTEESNAEQQNVQTSDKYFSISSFCESLNIDCNEFVQLLNNEQDLQNSKGIVIKSIDGSKKYRFSGKCDKSIFRGLVLDISEEVSELKKLKYILAHDPLTGLPNRYRLNEKIQKFCNKSETDLCALYFMDLNKFKSINDTYGHEVGDSVLKHISTQFKAQKDSNILPIRLSGDEFLIIKRGVENVDHADSFISQFTNKISASSFTVDGDIQSTTCNATTTTTTTTTLPIYFSYGGVVFNKSETKVSSIIKSADEKMYQMKKGISKINVIEFEK